MKKRRHLYVNLLLALLFLLNLLFKIPGREIVFYIIIFAFAVNNTIARLPDDRRKYEGELLLKITRARAIWFLLGLVTLVGVFALISSNDKNHFSYNGFVVCLLVLSEVFIYFYNWLKKPILFVINGDELTYTLNTGKTYDATALIQVSKRIMLGERIYILTFEDDPEIEFDSRQFRKEDLKNFLEVLIQKSRFAVDVNPEIQQHFNLVVSADGIRKPRPGIYGQFADEPFDLADFDAISVRWREAGMAYSDAVKLVMEKTGMLMGDARNTVEASAGWNR